MAMEKYGVSDVESLQQEELERTQLRLHKLRETIAKTEDLPLEKTARINEEIERLTMREAELKLALSQQ